MGRRQNLELSSVGTRVGWQLEQWTGSCRWLILANQMEDRSVGMGRKRQKRHKLEPRALFAFWVFFYFFKPRVSQT